MTPFLQLALSLIIIITGAKASGWLANRLRQPAMMGELLAGLLLGPSVLNMMAWPILANSSEPRLLTGTVFQLAELGVVCLMFLAGLEMDTSEMRRSGRVAILTGIGGVLLTLAAGGLAATLFGYRGQSDIFIGMILATTSVSISAQTLLELGVLCTCEGLVLLGAAVMDAGQIFCSHWRCCWSPSYPKWSAVERARGWVALPTEQLCAWAWA